MVQGHVPAMVCEFKSRPTHNVLFQSRSVYSIAKLYYSLRSQTVSGVYAYASGAHAARLEFKSLRAHKIKEADAKRLLIIFYARYTACDIMERKSNYAFTEF